MKTHAGDDPLFDALRKLLRSRGIGYRELGEAIGLSESGVKKIFAHGNCSVRRLAQIAAFLDVPLSELARLSEEPPIRRVELTDDQQRWLVENLDCFAFYWKLAVEKWSMPRIKDAYALTEAELWRYLGALDNLGLVIVEPGDRVRVVQQDLVRWRDRGPLLELLNRTWAERLLHDVLAEGAAARRVFRLTHLAMRPATARELADALEKLTDEFVRRARVEQATTPGDGLLTARLLIALGEGSFVEAIARSARPRDKPLRKKRKSR